MSLPSDEEINRMIASRLAAKLADSPKSMAWVLARYKEAEGVDDAAVARQLGIDEHQLHHLAMFLRPHPYLFAEHIETMSERFGIDELRLAALVRHVETLESFRQYEVATDTGLVAAARDVAEEEADYDAAPDDSPPDEPSDEQ